MGGDSPASHTMLVLGTGPVFLSHLPMFMKPHDYQVILQASFSNSGSDPQRLYLDDRKAHPKTLLYTLQPKAFVLPDLFPPSPGQPRHLRSFQASLFRGDFEHPDADTAEIAANVVVTVAGVVLGHKFVPGAPALDQLAYVLFGKGPELWLAHLITRPPTFDQVLSTTVAGHAFTDQELRVGVPVTVPSRKDVAAERLGLPQGGAAVDAVASVAGVPVPIQLQPQVEFYFNDNSDLQ
jgi:hypothetical protein